MRPDVAARFNGIEKTLDTVLVASMNIPVLAQSGAIRRLSYQLVEILLIEGLHDSFSGSSFESSHNLANRSINGKLPLKESAATRWQFICL